MKQSENTTTETDRKALLAFSDPGEGKLLERIGKSW